MGPLDRPIEQADAIRITPGVSRPNVKKDSNKNITIDLNSNNGVDLNKTDKDILDNINKYLRLLGIDSDYESLPKDKQAEIRKKYENGTLRKEYIDKVAKIVKDLRDCENNDERVNKILEVILIRDDADFNNLSQEEKEQKIAQKKEEILALIPKTYENKTIEGRIERSLYYVVTSALLLEKKLDVNTIKGLLNSAMPRYNSDFTSTVATLTSLAIDVPRDPRLNKHNAKQAEYISGAKEYAKSKDTTNKDYEKGQLTFKDGFDYLQNKLNNDIPLNDEEQNEYQNLLNLKNNFGSLDGLTYDTNIRNTENSLLDKYLLEVLANDNDTEISLLDINDEQKDALVNAFLQDFNECQSPEEQKEFIKLLYYTTRNDVTKTNLISEMLTSRLANINPEIVEDAIQGLNINTEEQEEIMRQYQEYANAINELIESDEELRNSLDNSFLSAFGESSQAILNKMGDVVHNTLSAKALAGMTFLQNIGNLAETQQKEVATSTTLDFVEAGILTEEQAGNFEVNVVANDVDESVLKGVFEDTRVVRLTKDKMPELTKNLEARNAELPKELSASWASNEDLTEDERAGIFRDLIDFANDDDLRAFYESLAKEHSIDYTSAPPREERVRTASSTTNSSGQNVASSSYNNYNTANALNREGDPFGFLNVLTTHVKNGIDSALEAIATVLDNQNDKPQQKLTSFDDALSALNEAGMQKLPKIFAQSSIGVKQELIKYVFTQNKDDIIPLIKSFGGVAIFALAEGSGKKMFIYQETKKLAMNDSSLKPDVKAMEEILKKFQNGQMDLSVI